MKKLKSIYVISFLLVSCTYKVPNVEYCATLSDDSAHCIKSVTKEERSISPDDWYLIRNNRLSVSIDDAGKIIKFIETVCKDTGKCSREEIDKWKTDLIK